MRTQLKTSQLAVITDDDGSTTLEFPHAVRTWKMDENQTSELLNALGFSDYEIEKAINLDCVVTDGCKATTETIQPKNQ